MSNRHKALGRNRGQWAASTDYLRGDVVNYQGALYAANITHTSAATFDLTKFDVVLGAPTTPTASSIGAAKNTAGPGLPPFFGRNAGDTHLDTNTGKSYTLAGQAGNTLTDDFNRPDAAVIGTPSGGGAYATSNGNFSIANNKLRRLSGTRPYASFDLGAGAKEATVVFQSEVLDAAIFSLALGTTTASPTVTGVGVQVMVGADYVNMVVLRAGGSGTANGTVNKTGSGLTEHKLTFRVDGPGAVGDIVSCFLDDVLVWTFVNDYAVTGTNVSILSGSSMTATYTIDSITAFALGTLEWKLTSSTPPKITQGSGLPTFADRLPNDLHYDSATGRTYILTGAPGAGVTDVFGRADGAPGTSTSGAVWTSPAGSPVISGKKLVKGSGSTSIYAPIGAGALAFAFDWTPQSTAGTETVTIGGMTTAAGANPSGQITLTPGTAWFSASASIPGVASGGMTRTGTDFATVPGRTYRVRGSMSPAGVFSVNITDPITGAVQYFDKIHSAFTAAGSHVSVAFGSSSTATNAVDNLIAQAIGTLAWTLTTPHSVQVPLITGNATGASNLLKPGLRVPVASKLRQVVLRAEEAPTGGPLTITVERFNNGASQGVIATASIPDGLTVGSVAVTADCAAGDMLKFHNTVIGPTTPGADVAASLDFY